MSYEEIMAVANALLTAQGMAVEETGAGLRITVPGVVNPADVRMKVADILSREGFSSYYLAEFYAYQGAKKPWRTDTEAFVELVGWDNFNLKPIHSAGKKK